MLVLSRKKNQTIYIGPDIKLTVVEISGDTVKLGITAPRQVDILRAEVLDAVSRENRQAAGKETNAQQLLDMINWPSRQPAQTVTGSNQTQREPGPGIKTLSNQILPVRKNTQINRP
ncbi:carbon storage regulator CsrA [Desulfurispora thermophila]|uniref:carbon storage regulator CsrA n=1 Tax=Desulfurispora thermophila TaxID=265470 RepID=UPI00036702E4|nr:carbon storage regulator CsrA [Desulfurispora thermophila]